MAYVVTAPCVGVKDGACMDVCPVFAFRDDPNEPQVYIHPDICLDCGACVAACPVEAIFADVDVPPQWESYIALNDRKARELDVLP